MYLIMQKAPGDVKSMQVEDIGIPDFAKIEGKIEEFFAKKTKKQGEFRGGGIGAVHLQ